MIGSLITAFLTSLAFLLTTFLIPFLISLFTNFSLKKAINTTKNLLYITGTKVLFITLVFNATVFFAITWSYEKFHIADFPVLNVAISIFVVFFIMSYSFILSPILSIRFNSNFVREPKYTEFLATRFDADMVVRVVDCDLKNAYATGILPFYKIILLGRPLVEQMTEVELKGVIAHEYAHNKFNHVLKIYLVSLFGILLNFGLFYAFLKVNFHLPEAFKFAILGGVGGFINFTLLPGIFRKRFEFQADSFAAETIGAEDYERALKRLDRMTDGALTRGSSTHPNLEQRIKNIYKNHE
ncbi:M48 family metallopeptidase [Pedobacter aquatilis]|uniref:M48 family metallopeptidase n=1 Tax=Pedobacter aquatilis TaxID=351343 RepID=UPI0029308F79|nr:M48 family metalloprotease [Pedobacter aquatilis]